MEGYNKMSQEDYREKIEEHRQAINIESEQETNPSRMTRSELHGKKNKNKKNNHKNRLVTLLAIIFILLPVSTLIYYGYFMQDENSKKAEIDNGGIQIETNDNGQSKDATKVSNDDEKLTKKEQAENERAEKLAAKKAAAKEKAEKEKAQQKEKEDAAAKEKQQQIYNEAKAAGRLYNVKQGETIESIAIKFYGSDAGVAIIKEANGITGDTVSPGTTIAIPAQ